MPLFGKNLYVVTGRHIMNGAFDPLDDEIFQSEDEAQTAADKLNSDGSSQNSERRWVVDSLPDAIRALIDDAVELATMED